MLSLSGFSLPFCFLSSAFCSGSGYLASVSSFPLSSRFPPHSGSSNRCSPSAFAFRLFPVLSNLVSHVFLPGSSYSASCSFLFIPPGFAPTAVPPVPPLCFRFRAFPFPSAFFRPLLSGSDYSAFRLSFPFFPFSPVGGSSGATFLFRPACFHAFLSILVLSLLQFPFPVRCLASQWLPQRLRLPPFGFRLLPLCFRFRFWLLGLEPVPFQIPLSCALLIAPASTLAILSHVFLFVNNFFKFFRKIFKLFFVHFIYNFKFYMYFIRPLILQALKYLQ